MIRPAFLLPRVGWRRRSGSVSNVPSSEAFSIGWRVGQRLGSNSRKRYNELRSSAASLGRVRRSWQLQARNTTLPRAGRATVFWMLEDFGRHLETSRGLGRMPLRQRLAKCREGTLRQHPISTRETRDDSRKLLFQRGRGFKPELTLNFLRAELGWREHSLDPARDRCDSLGPQSTDPGRKSAHDCQGNSITRVRVGGPAQTHANGILYFPQ